MKKLLALLLAMAMVLAIFAGCEATESPSGSQAVAETPEKESSITIALADYPRNFDPLVQSSAWEYYIVYNVVNTVLAYKIDFSDVIPCLGELKEVSEDGLRYTFTIRDDVYFHPGKFQDGRKMTAADVEYSLMRSAASSTGDALSMIDHCEVISDTEIIVCLNDPSATFLTMLTSSVNGIVPKEEVEGWGDEFTHHLCGTGPYIFSEYVADEKVVLKKNDKYWMKEPGLDTVTYTIITDAAQRANALLTGEVDFANDVSNEYYDTIEASPDCYLYQSPKIGFNFLYFNTNVGACSDIRVRQALTMAIDADELVAGMWPNGEAVRNYLPVPEGSWGYDEELVELVPKYDPEGARELLKGTEYENGFSVDLYYSATDVRIKMATILQARLLENLNCTVNLHQSDFATFSEATCAGTAEIGTISWSSWPDPHYFLYNFFHSSAAGTLGGGSGLHDPEIDELLDKAQLITDISERKAIYKVAIEKILAQYPGLYFAATQNVWGVSNKLNDVHPRSDGVFFLCTEDVNVTKN